MVKSNLLKLTILFVTIIYLQACKSINEISVNKYLLEKNIISKNNEELINDPIKFLAVDKPNKKTLGIPFKLYFHQMAIEKPDSVFDDWLERKSKLKKKLNNLL